MYIFGAGGHGKAIIDLIISEFGLEIEGLFDDNENGEVMGISVSNIDNHHLAENQDFHIAIGNNKIRKEFSEKFKVNYPKLVHPSSTISKFSNIGEGTVVMPQCSIKAMTSIGQHCIINAGAIIGHDVKIGDYVHVAPNSAVAGFVNIEEGVHIGIGASIIQGVNVGKWSIVGAGAVIIKDVPDFSVVVGNPGKVIKSVIHHDTTP